MGELVSNKNRGPINALVLFTSLPFAVFGPPVARAFYTNTALQWRWSYILGVIVNTIAVILYIIFYHPPTYVSVSACMLVGNPLIINRKCCTLVASLALNN